MAPFTALVVAHAGHGAQNEFPWWIVTIGAVWVVTLAVVFFVSRRKGGSVPDADEPADDQQSDQVV